MFLSPLFARELDTSLDAAGERRGFFGTTCEQGATWFQWCPVDVVLWVLLLCIFLLICWKVYITNRVGPNSPGQRKAIKAQNGNFQCHLELPRPEELFPSSQQHYCTYGFKIEDNNKPHAFADLFNDSPDTSPVPQLSDSVNSTPNSGDTPFKREYSSGVGLGISIEFPRAETLYTPEADMFEEGKKKLATPDPAHIRSPR